MSDTDTTTEAPAPKADATTTEPAAHPEADSPNKEAAKYRRQLREAETARDALTARVQTYQTEAAERLAVGPGNLLDASDLWRVTDLASLLDDADELDPEKVSAAVAELVAAKPHYAAPTDPIDTMDLGSHLGGISTKTAATWADAFQR